LPDEAEDEKSTGLPVGTVNDLLDVLADLSLRFDVDGEIGNIYERLGFIRRGVID
jgi:hypothetical protein